jgi:putative MATE family efflux protein
LIGLNRQIARLALPALGALLAEPTFLLVDTAIVGHLGTAQLAGVGVAGTILTTAVGLSVFLAYGTTSLVARRLGAGDLRAALASGIDGVYLAIAIGVVLAVAGIPTAAVLVDALGADSQAAHYGTTYLLISLTGLPAMLVVLATTGVLRGLQDTTTPLAVAVAGAVLNTVLNLTFVYRLHWGVAGSAIGTAITQNLMAIALVTVVVRAARQHDASLRPHLSGITGAGLTGIPLFLRTLALRVAILLSTAVAARQGLAALAANQVVTAVWNFLALGLDAIAIAAQALTGKALGAGDLPAARALTRAMVRWGLLAGAVVGVVLIAIHALVGRGFTTDPDVRAAIAVAMIVLAVALPMAGYVFVLDGVLIGAGDGWYLAWTGGLNLLGYLPALVVLWVWPPGGWLGLMWLWIAHAGLYLGLRALTLGLRYRGNRWLVAGVG